MQPETAASQIDAYYWEPKFNEPGLEKYHNLSETVALLPNGEFSPENVNSIFTKLRYSLDFNRPNDTLTKTKFVAAKTRDQIGILFFHQIFQHVDALAKLRQDILKEETPIFGGGFFVPAAQKIEFNSDSIQRKFDRDRPKELANQQELIAAVRESILLLFEFQNRVKAEVAAQKA